MRRARQRSRGWRFVHSYLLAVLAVVVALGARLLLRTAADDRSEFALFTLAVMISAWYGGFGPGLAATFIGAAAGTHFFLQPFNLAVPSLAQLTLDIGLFIADGIGISWLAGELLKSRKRAEDQAERMLGILASISDAFLALDRGLRFIYLNAAAEQIIGTPKRELIGKSVVESCDFFVDGELRQAFRRAAKEQVKVRVECYWASAGRWFQITAYPAANGGLSVYVSEITLRKQAELERDQLIGTLQHKLASVKLLNGFLPICAACKKIRDDQGSWHPVESYVRAHSEAEFTHSICPDCIPKFFSEIA
jgi:PAS domain S-box-containing protein